MKMRTKIANWFKDNAIALLMGVCIIFSGLYAVGYFIRSIKM